MEHKQFWKGSKAGSQNAFHEVHARAIVSHHSRKQHRNENVCKKIQALKCHSLFPQPLSLVFLLNTSNVCYVAEVVLCSLPVLRLVCLESCSWLSPKCNVLGCMSDFCPVSCRHHWSTGHFASKKEVKDWKGPGDVSCDGPGIPYFWK